MKEKINRILHKKIPNRYFVYAVMVVVCVLLGKRLVEDYIAYNFAPSTNESAQGASQEASITTKGGHNRRQAPVIY